MYKGESKGQVREKLTERRERQQVPKEVVVDAGDPQLQDSQACCSSSSEELILRFFKSSSSSSATSPPVSPISSPLSRHAWKRHEPMPSPPSAAASSSPNDTTTSASAGTPCNSPLGEMRHHHPQRSALLRQSEPNPPKPSPLDNDDDAVKLSNSSHHHHNNNNKNSLFPEPLAARARSKSPNRQPQPPPPSTAPPDSGVSPRPPPPPITPRPRTTKTIYSKLPKGKVFGVPLSTLTTDPGSGVPLIVRDLVEALSCHLWTEGLFRIPGTSTTVDELRGALDRQHEHEEDILGNIRDPHDLSSLLKLFLRELPDPLFTFELFLPLINTQSNPDLESRAECLQILLESLEKPHYNVVRFLCRFLRKVSEHKAHNKMTVENLAMVFAPNVIRPKNEVASTIQFDYKQARLTLEDIITNSRVIFPL
eukprot:TRINITY_DN2818_c0_g1_i1.p1 TRINITY_DN2818_c0_g1~~TRINITY_DN2818_c0_g1_i1.p1  ORF type:complete len:423 (+),score=117.39 TRINITY_DN2818_c0_g1_i1:220-1488(+)